MGLSDEFEGRSDSETPLWRTGAQEQSKRLTHWELGIYMTQGRPSGTLGAASLTASVRQSDADKHIPRLCPSNSTPNDTS